MNGKESVLYLEKILIWLLQISQIFVMLVSDYYHYNKLF